MSSDRKLKLGESLHLYNVPISIFSKIKNVRIQNSDQKDHKMFFKLFFELSSNGF